jgi:predicted alpha/beta hydrolase
VRQTNTPVVAFLFQDDQWSPNYLADADAALEKNPSVGFVTMNHKIERCKEASYADNRNKET